MNAGSIPAATYFLLAIAAPPCCVPATFAYATIPVTTEDGLGRELAVVELELARLAPYLQPFAPSLVTVYDVGRRPLPCALVDRDGDGEPDALRVELPIPPGTGIDLVVTCPGPRAARIELGSPASAGVVVRYDRIQP